MGRLDWTARVGVGISGSRFVGSQDVQVVDIRRSPGSGARGAVVAPDDWAWRVVCPGGGRHPPAGRSLRGRLPCPVLAGRAQFSCRREPNPGGLRPQLCPVGASGRTGLEQSAGSALMAETRGALGTVHQDRPGDSGRRDRFRQHPHPWPVRGYGGLGSDSDYSGLHVLASVTGDSSWHRPSP